LPVILNQGPFPGAGKCCKTVLAVLFTKEKQGDAAQDPEKGLNRQKKNACQQAKASPYFTFS
jgi:murein endopeptidase